MRLWALILGGLTGCAPGLDTADCPPGTPTWGGWAEGFFAGQCQACHATSAPDRHGAPEDVVFDTMTDTLRHADRIRDRTLERGDMPPAGGVHEEEVVLLGRWLDCPVE